MTVFDPSGQTLIIIQSVWRLFHVKYINSAKKKMMDNRDEWTKIG